MIYFRFLTLPGNNMKLFLNKISLFTLLLTLIGIILMAEIIKDYLVQRQVNVHYAVPYQNQAAINRFQLCLGEEMRSRVNFIQMFVWDENRHLNERWFSAENSCKVVLMRFDWANQTQSEKYYNGWRRSKPVEYPYFVVKDEPIVAQYIPEHFPKKIIPTAKVTIIPKHATLHPTTSAGRTDPTKPTKLAMR